MATSGLATSTNGLATLAVAAVDQKTWPAGADSLFWDPSAPERVIRSYRDGDAAKGWKQWRRHFRRRGGLLEQLKRKQVVRLLACEDLTERDQTDAVGLIDPLTARVGGKSWDPAAASDKARDWLTATDGIGPWHPSAAEAWQAVLWSHALLPLARMLDAPTWWQLVARLQHLAAHSATSLDEDPLAHQLVAGELRWTLARLLGEVTPCRELAAEAIGAMSAVVAESLDGQGVVHGRLLGIFRPLLASWIRCRLWCELSPADADDELCWGAAAEERFPLALREALRLSRHDRRIVELAAEQTLNKNDRRTIRRLLAATAETRPTKPAKKRGRAGGLPPSAIRSESSQLAVLQTDWSARANRWTAAYSDQAVRIELEAGRHTLIAGNWDWEIRIDGVRTEPLGDWSEVCWISSRRCDYLELEIKLSAGLRLQRQMLLSREDEFLFLADVVLGPTATSAKPHELEYLARLPLGAGISAATGSETRELVLSSHKPRAMVLPLALPEWRVDPRGGILHEVAGCMELRQLTRGGALLAPLWIDLAPRRFRRPSTWRQLTVAEQLQIQPHDVAAGYRIQFGKRQWLVYRSLKMPGNRTLLGQNLSSEFYVGASAATGNRRRSWKLSEGLGARD